MDTDFQRFMSRVIKNGPVPCKSTLGNCWLWAGAKDVFGYGRFKVGRTNHQAHRWIAAQQAGVTLRWDKGTRQTVNHRCGNRACVRPSHLYIGDQKSNVADAVSDSTHHSVSERREAAARNECVNGHEYTTKNTYINRSGGRVCRKCQAIAQARYRRKRTSVAQLQGVTR